MANDQPAIEPQIDNPAVGSPRPAEVLPQTAGELGQVPVGRLERALTAITQGLTLLEGSGSVLKTRQRKTLKDIQERLTPAVHQSGKIYRFGFAYERLLGFMAETGDFRISCIRAGLNEGAARSFLSSPKFLNFFKDRVTEAAVQRGWTADKIVAELDKVWTGEKKADREQMEAIKMIADRKYPKVERVSHSFEDAEIEFTTRNH